MAPIVLTAAVLTACGGGDQSAVALPDCLDLGAVYALTGPESIGAYSWSDATALAAELQSPVADEFPHAPLTIFGPGEESGTFDSFTELAIAGLAEERGVAEDLALPRPDYISSPNDNVIIEGVSGADNSYGWVGFAFAEENSDVVREIEVAGEDGTCVAPSVDTIADGSYPLSRPLFIYVNADKAAENPALAAFVDYYTGDAGYAAVSDAGYVQMPEEDFAAAIAAWADAGGTPGEPESGVSGEVIISGSSTVEPISSAAAEGFSADNPDVSVSVDGPGTGDGFGRQPGRNSGPGSCEAARRGGQAGSCGEGRLGTAADPEGQPLPAAAGQEPAGQGQGADRPDRQERQDQPHRAPHDRDEPDGRRPEPEAREADQVGAGLGRLATASRTD